MRLFIVGKNRAVIDTYRKHIRNGFTYTGKNPEIVIPLGGDGSLLYAERRFPGIPKLPIRDHSICHACDWDSLGAVLQLIRKGKYRIETHQKLEARAKTRNGIVSKQCLNDIVIRNRKQTEAIRFTVRSGSAVHHCIGDGIVAATPFGSSGYFHSITQRTFGKGMGVAFNNTTEKIKPRIAKRIIFRLVRNSAILSSDNDPGTVALREGDSVTIKKSERIARLIKIARSG